MEFKELMLANKEMFNSWLNDDTMNHYSKDDLIKQYIDCILTSIDINDMVVISKDEYNKLKDGYLDLF